MFDPPLVTAALQHFPPGFRLAFGLWAVPVVGAGTFLLTHLAGRELLGPLRAARRDHGAGLHWTDHNRLGWRARRGAVLLPLAAASSVALAAASFTGPLGLLTPGWRGLVLGGWALACGLFAAHQVTREALPAAVSFRERLSGLAGVVGLRLFGLVTSLGCGLLWDPERAWTAGLAVGSAAVCLGLLSRGAGIRLLRLLGLVQPASPRLVDAVRRAAVNARAPLPGVAVLSGWAPNAFALPEARLLLFTRGAQTHLPVEQLEAVASHELGHLAEGPALGWLRRLPLLLVLPLSLWRGLFLVEHVGYLLAGGGLYWALVLLVKRGLARRLRAAESEADAASHHHGTTYARALEATYRLGGVPAVLSQRSVHPSLFDRMQAAGVEPDWPRPAPPPPMRVGRLAAWMSVPLLAPLAGWTAVATVSEGERVGLAPVVLTAGAPVALLGHARTRAAHGQEPEACTDLMHLSCDLQPTLWSCAEAAIWLAEIGRCDEAKRVLAIAGAALGEGLGDGPERAGATTYLGVAGGLVAACAEAPARPPVP